MTEEMLEQETKPESIPEETPETNPENTTDAALEETPESIPEEVTEVTADEKSDETPETVLEEVTEVTADEKSDEAAEAIPNEKSDEAAEAIPNEKSDETAEAIPNEKSDETAENAPEETPETALEEVTEVTADEKSDETAENVAETPENIPEKNIPPEPPVRFVLATHNPNKLREMRDILSELNVEVISPEEAGVNVDVEETGATFAENALLKAKAVCNASGLPAIGDDSGLCVDALNGAPGIYSARYGGDVPDSTRCQLVLQALRGATSRAAHFTCAIAAAFPNGNILTAERRCDGAIAFAALGAQGFGYDPIFLIPEKGRTFGQMDESEKNTFSHRAKALAAFVKALRGYLEDKEHETWD